LAFEVRAKPINESVEPADRLDLARDHLAILAALENGHTVASASMLAAHCWHIIEDLQKQLAGRERKEQKVSV
jgi:DNA-binding GntR family transcriptional regulator